MDYIAIPASSLLMLSNAVPGVYPLAGINQCILKWYLATMPTGASFVSIQPVSARAILFASSAAESVGTIANGARRLEFFGHTFSNYDTTNNRTNLYRDRFWKSAIDGTLSVDSLTYNFGSRVAIQLADPYLAFLVQHDGTTNTGSMSVSVDLSWA